MTLAQVRGISAALGQMERDALLSAAIAARVAQADAKDWKAWVKEVQSV